jgi:hypothetical protein
MRLARLHHQGLDSEDRDMLPRDLEWLSGPGDSGIDGLLPLVLHGVSRAGLRGRLSENCRRRLEAGRLQQIAMVDRHRTWVTQLESRLIKEDLQIVLLKGAAFTGTVYSEDLPRGASDIDFLVKKGDFEKVCHLLAEEATRPAELAKRKVSFRMDYERGFLFGDTVPFVVEVHRGLTNPIIFSIDELALWKNSRPHPGFASERVRVLSPEDNILHLAVHGYRHLDVMNHNLVDAHELICGQDPDWPVILHNAEGWRARGALYMLLKSARDILHTPVPAEVLKSLQPGQVADSAADAVYRYKRKYGLHYGQAGYRVVQLLGQLCVPDSFPRVMAFQGYYGAIRLLDFVDVVRRRYRGDDEMG